MELEHTFIRVDHDVFEWLKSLANEGETPNTVLRRVARLPERPQGRRSSILKPFPKAEAAA